MQLASSDRPLALVIEESLGSRAGDVVAWIALAATANTTLLVHHGGIAPPVRHGRGSGALPRALASVGARGGAPYVGALITLAIAAVFVLPGDVGLVAAVTDFAVYCTFLSVNLAVIALRARHPARSRPFRVPFSVASIPVLPVLGTVSVLTMVAFLDPGAWALGIGALVVGAGAFALIARYWKERLGHRRALYK